MFGQTFDIQDLAVIGILIVLEGVLSIDNALVLGILAKRLPKFLQARALTYGLVGALVFRLLAVALAGVLLKWHFPKLLGGIYLLWVALKHFFWDEASEEDKNEPVPTINGMAAPPGHHHPHVPHMGKNVDFAHASSTHSYAFWSTVVVIELTDIAFAVDSILAAVGTVPGREKLWLVITGGMLGVVLMRFAATLFIRLLEHFPRFELSAYLLVIVIGVKLILDYLFNRGEQDRLNFHSPTSLAFWVFWITMLSCFSIGFIRKGAKPTETPETPAETPQSP
ncbi:MAG TPA: hypothetical protein VF669_03285 [Tepidisphaeraceae bacterium]|jgi:YkoY family integral membrane protein